MSRRVMFAGLLGLWLCMNSSPVGAAVSTGPSGNEGPSARLLEWRVELPDGSSAVLAYPEAVEPLRPFQVTLKTAVSGRYALIVDAQRVGVSPDAPARVTLSGPQGPHTMQLERDGRVVGTTIVLLWAATRFEAGPFTDLFDRLRATVRKDRDRSPRLRHGQPIHTNPHWVRDHIHEMKAYKYWEQDLSSYVDTLLDLQHPDGFFYEILASRGHDYDHLGYVTAKHRLEEPQEGLGWVRLEIEADVEYLMVEAAYTIWQATGDDAAMRGRLPHLDRALRYDFTDPTRWDAKLGALKRTFTIDTWDFTYGVPTDNRRIEPGMPMGVMHGDNSGLYQACRQLAVMYRAAGDDAKAAEWDTKGADLRDRVNRLCFNGRFYTHQVLLQPVETGVKEEEILSLSNAYDMNRGLPTHEMSVKILDEYRRRREARAATHFAEWFSIDPPYPKFCHYNAGQYINGGIASFVAGELAKAAFCHGREAYGADILRRVADKVAKDGAIYFLYTPDGRNQGGGPSGWGAAAVTSALIEGLAGIQDESVLFRQVTVSPRFLAAGIDQARVCARYAPSGAYVAMNYEHRPADRTIHLDLAGVARKTRLQVLLPKGAHEATITSPGNLRVEMKTIEQSRYAVVELPAPLTQGVANVTIEYRP